MSTYQVLPLLLEALGSKESDVKQSALSGLLAVFSDSPNSLSEHVPTLLPLLLTLTADKRSMVSVKHTQQTSIVMIATGDSQECSAMLGEFVHSSSSCGITPVLPTALFYYHIMQIYPYRHTVLRSLSPCLDDHKRIVRRAAVDARAKWLSLTYTQVVRCITDLTTKYGEAVLEV